MAKAPVPGRAKTRLVPPLDAAEAAGLAAAFIADTTANIGAAGLAAYAAYAPAGDEALLAGACAAGTRLLLADGSLGEAPGVAGFGRALLHAARGLFAEGHDGACLLSADSPTVPTRFLTEAARLLGAPGDRAVLGPAADGGYWLLGMRAAHARLFADIAWSTDTVAEATRARAREIGLELLELPVWYDVDDAASLARLKRELASPGADSYAAPATRAALDLLATVAA
jgi:glycosyltransferase A (GT-A) superfamily protein (DUF2064 family)